MRLASRRWLAFESRKETSANWSVALAAFGDRCVSRRLGVQQPLQDLGVDLFPAEAQGLHALLGRLLACAPASALLAIAD
ncbi:MAG: hypothetical protein U0361_20230 [Nitrospiraceae bacterium]